MLFSRVFCFTMVFLVFIVYYLLKLANSGLGTYSNIFVGHFWNFHFFIKSGPETHNLLNTLCLRISTFRRSMFSKLWKVRYIILLKHVFQKMERMIWKSVLTKNGSPEHIFGILGGGEYFGRHISVVNFPCPGFPSTP